MPFVLGSDYEQILAIVGQASSGTPDEPLPPAVLEQIRELALCDAVALFDGSPWDRARRRVWSTASPSVSPEESRVMDAYRFQVPLNPSPATLGRAIRVTDAMSRRSYQRLELYQLLGKSRGFEFAMDYWVARPGGVWGLRFDASAHDFSDRVRDRIEVLGPHLGVVLGRFGLPAAPGHPRLTAREAEILGHVLQGRTNRQIATALGISPHTVRTHLEHAFLSLGVHTRAEAVARLLERPATSG